MERNNKLENGIEITKDETQRDKKIENMSQQMTQFCSFLWLSNISLYICTTMTNKNLLYKNIN